ncbi:hypothetical protein, partial [Burkholderia multivorans]
MAVASTATTGTLQTIRTTCPNPFECLSIPADVLCADFRRFSVDAHDLALRMRREFVDILLNDPLNSIERRSL